MATQYHSRHRRAQTGEWKKERTKVDIDARKKEQRVRLEIGREPEAPPGGGYNVGKRMMERIRRGEVSNSAHGKSYDHRVEQKKLPRPFLSKCKRVMDTAVKTAPVRRMKLDARTMGFAAVIALLWLGQIVTVV